MRRAFSPGSVSPSGSTCRTRPGTQPAISLSACSCPMAKRSRWFPAREESPSPRSRTSAESLRLWPPFSLNNPGFLEFTFPTEGVPVRTYVAFSALLRQGALANNQIDPGELLASDAKTFTFSTGPPSGAVPLLSSPFAGDYSTSNFFDHVVPQE